MKMRPMHRAAAGFGGVLVLAVLAVAVVLGTMDFSRYKGLVVEAVRAATGRELTIAGEIDLSLGLTPALVVEKITLANAPWGSRPEMLTVGRVEVKVALLPLLSRKIVVKRLVLREPDILLETDAAGLGNWVFPQSAESSREIPEVHHVVVEEGVLRYRDGKSGRVVLLALEKMAARAAGLESPIAIELSGAWNTAPLTAQATLGSLRALTAGQAFPLSLTAEAAGARIGIEGTVAGATGNGLDLAVRLEGNDLAELAALAEVRLRPTRPYRLSGRLRGIGNGYRFSEMKAALGESDLAGSVDILSGGPRPSLAAELLAGHLDLREFLPAGEQASPARPGGKGAGRKVFSAELLDLEPLRAVDARVRLRADRITTPSLLLEKAGLDLVLAGGRLTLQPANARVAGGALTVALSLDSAAARPRLRLSLTTRGVLAGRLLEQLGKNEIMSGVPLDTDLEISGAGRSLREIMAALDGRLLLQAGPGRVNNRYLDFAGGDALSQLLAALHPAAVRREHTALECAVLNATARDGIVTTNRGIAAKTALMTVVGSGGINLKTEELDIGLKPSARSGIGINLGQLAGAVRLGGTLAEPGVRVDPLGAAKTAATIGGAIATGGVSLLAGALFERATADEDPCRTALGRGAAAPSPGEQERREEGIGGVLRGLFGR